MSRVPFQIASFGALQPTLAELLSPYVDKALAATSLPPAAGNNNKQEPSGQLHLLQAEPWSFAHVTRRWSNSPGEDTRKFEKRYPHLESAFERLRSHYSVDSDKLNALVCAGRIDAEICARALSISVETTGFVLNLMSHDEKALERLAASEFFDGLTKLASAGVPIARLERYFALFPDTLYKVATEFSKHFSELAPYLTSSGEMDLARLLADRQKTLTINIWEVASLHATRGLLQQMALPRERIKLELSDGISKELVEKHFPELTIKGKFHPENDPAEIFIRFKDSATIDRSGDISLFVSYQPFKFAVPERVAVDKRREIRERMGLSPDRPVIVVSSPEKYDIEVLIPIISELKKQAASVATRPLVILGMRYPGSIVAQYLNNSTDLIACARTIDDQEKSPDKWLVSGQGLADLDVVVLDTQGELMDLFAIADLAVVGANRNLMEPAAQGVPILYVRGDWDCNMMAKTLLDEAGAAEEIDDARFSEQVRLRLAHPERYRDRADAAVTRLNDELMPDAAALVVLSLAAMVVKGR